MPLSFFPGATGRIHWRHWPAASPRAGLIFAHGLGQHTGHYHRFAAALGARGIAVWGLDLAGHGFSEGPPGAPGDVADHAADLAVLTGRAEDSGLPLALMGHSLGSASALTLMRTDAHRFSALVLCGTPRTAATPETARVLSSSGVPVLLVHGVDDRLAPIDAVRTWAAAPPNTVVQEYENAGHDLLHEPVHRAVTADIARFVLDAVG